MHEHTVSISCEIEEGRSHFLISKELLLEIEDKLSEISFDYDEEGECYNNDENMKLLAKLQDEVFSQVNVPKEVIGEKIDERIKVLQMIAEDTKEDAKRFDGRPFNGRTVAEYFGNHGAAIAAIANVVKSILEEKGSVENGK